MADQTYDIVIVGAGNKSLIAAMYLTKYGGLSVGMFEDRHESGGGWCSEESPAPGFMANHCSNYHADVEVYHKPVFEDFPEWEEYGAKYVYHKMNIGVHFQEDDSYIGYYNSDIDPDGTKSAEIIAKFSQKDAETWVWLIEKINKYIRPAVYDWVFNPALPFGQPDAMDKLIANPDSGIDPSWLYMTPIQVAQDLFESPEAQVLLPRGIMAAGCPPDVAGLGAALLPWLVVWMKGGCCVGGNHSLVHACQRVIYENKGKIQCNATVKKIIIENGQATGIRLADGTEIAARKAVLSSVDPYQLCFNLVGEENFPRQTCRRIKHLERDWTAISWYTWAFHEAPEYKAQASFPDADSGFPCMCSKDILDLKEESNRLRMGMWPDPEKLQLACMNNSAIDPSLAPPGKATVLTEQYVLSAHFASAEEWKVYEKRHAEEILKYWQKFAPNVTRDNLIGYQAVHPYFTSQHALNWSRDHGNFNVIDPVPHQIGRFRPILEWADHRIRPIKGLYGTGSGWHPLPAAHSWQGYNAYKILAEDFGLRKPWEEKDRRF